MRNRFGLETKAADDGDDLDDALEQVAKTVEERTEKKVAKLIADAMKPLNDGLTSIEKKMNRPAGLLGGSSGSESANAEATVLETKAIRSFLKSGARDFVLEQHLSGDELKAMRVSSDPDGGAIVFPQLSASINKRLYDQSPMRRLCDVQTITEGDSWEEPIDFDDLGATWVEETEERPETSTPQVGMFRVPLHEIYAEPKISQKMIDTASWNIAAWIEGKIADRFGRTEGQAFILGNDIKKPRGILNYPTSPLSDGAPGEGRPLGTIQTIASGAATALTPDGLKKMVWKLRSPYRTGACWLMNSNTAGAIDLFKDNNGQYMWREGMTSGAQPSLLGYPVEIDENMPDVGAGALPIAFGNFKRAYVIVDMGIYKIRQDPFTAKPHVLFYTYKRVGGRLRNSEAIKLQVVSA